MIIFQSWVLFNCHIFQGGITIGRDYKGPLLALSGHKLRLSRFCRIGQARGNGCASAVLYRSLPLSTLLKRDLHRPGCLGSWIVCRHCNQSRPQRKRESVVSFRDGCVINGFQLIHTGSLKKQHRVSMKQMGKVSGLLIYAPMTYPQ